MRVSELSIGWACRACICPQESTKKLVRHTIRPKCVRKRKMTRSKSSMLWTEFRQKFLPLLAARLTGTHLILICLSLSLASLRQGWQLLAQPSWEGQISAAISAIPCLKRRPKNGLLNVLLRLPVRTVQDSKASVSCRYNSLWVL